MKPLIEPQKEELVLKDVFRGLTPEARQIVLAAARLALNGQTGLPGRAGSAGTAELKTDGNTVMDFTEVSG